VVLVNEEQCSDWTDQRDARAMAWTVRWLNKARWEGGFPCLVTATGTEDEVRVEDWMGIAVESGLASLRNAKLDWISDQILCLASSFRHLPEARYVA
jgi:hypothetical protein